MRRRQGVKVVAQRKNYDCGVAALAMLLNLPYGDVAAKVREQIDDKDLRHYGLHVWHCELIAEQLGHPLKRVYRKRDYLVNQTGLLGLLGEGMDPRGHWVVLKGGAIVDPDGAEVWDVNDYLAKYKARPCTLLVAA